MPEFAGSLIPLAAIVEALCAVRRCCAAPGGREKGRGGDAEMAHGRTEVDPLVPPLLLGHEQTLETNSVAGTIMTTQYIMGVAARPIKQM